MELRWDILINDDSRFPRLLYFGEFKDERFRYGVNEELQYCLYFNFESKPGNIPVETLRMANITLEEKIENGIPALILTLQNDSETVRNLFNDLIVSIVNQTRNVSASSAKSAFITLCNEWFELFDPLSGQLTREDLQGIFAEVRFLKYLLQSSKFTPNEILSSWKGPFGKGHDFELGDNHFEIKSVSEAKPVVSISSEYQLDYLEGQKLFLGVCQFSKANPDAISLSQEISEITGFLRSVTGSNLQIFWTALSKTGLNNSNIHNYDDYTFYVNTISWYNCTATDFPSICRSDGLSDAIRSVRYDLALSNIQIFLTPDITPFI